MSDFFKITIDPNEISRLFSDLPQVTKKATANTLNIVARKVNKNLKFHVTDKYNIPKRSMRIGGLISIKRANARTNIGNAIIFIRRQGRGLIKYGAKQIGPGISVKVKKATRVVKGGFIAPLRKRGSDEFAFIKATGKKAGRVMRRTEKGTLYEADKREIMYGPPIADLYTNKSAEGVILKTIDQEFQDTLDTQFNKQFEKGGRR